MKLFSVNGNKKRIKIIDPYGYTEEEKAEGRRIAALSEKRIRTRRITLLIMLLVLLALCSVIVYKYLTGVKPPEIIYKDVQTADNSVEAPKSEGEAAPESDMDSGIGVLDMEKDAAGTDDIYTFLVIGTDDGNGNSDTMLLCSFNVTAGTFDIVSIPRDTLVNVSRSVKKINAAWGVGGIDEVKAEVKSILGFTPNNYICVDLRAFVRLVDTIGGVYFDVPYNMNYDDPAQDLHIHVNAGYQLLTGSQAVGVVRWRQNNGGSLSVGDTGRIQIQQSFLMAVAKQCLSINNITKIKEFADIFVEYVDTDLTVGNIVWFAEQYLKLGIEAPSFHTMPGNVNDWAYGGSYVSIYVDEWLEMVNTYLNPYSSDVTVENVNILTRDIYGNLVTTGSGAAGTQFAKSDGVVYKLPAVNSSASSSQTQTTPDNTVTEQTEPDEEADDTNTESELIAEPPELDEQEMPGSDVSDTPETEETPEESQPTEPEESETDDGEQGDGEQDADEPDAETELPEETPSEELTSDNTETSQPAETEDLTEE